MGCRASPLGVPVSEVTRILQSVERGESSAERLLPLVYDELRQLAAHKMANELPGHTLQPTALVHEAWLRLVGAEQTTWQNRAHFFGAAAEAMRRILVERARRKRRIRHGGDQERVNWNDLEVAAPATDEKILLVNDALDKLAIEDLLEAEVVKLRFFSGLKHEEIAALLGVSEKTVQRYWAHAKAWLYEDIRRQG